jgi:ATP-dependent Zn protease
MFVGVGASSVRDLFRKRKKKHLLLFSSMRLMPLVEREEKTMGLTQMMNAKTH